MNNAVLDCIRARRSIRKFTDRQIAPEHLDAILEAAVWAPSGGNNQSWLFTAIQNRDALLRINELAREGFANWTPDDDYPGKRKAKKNALNADYNFYYHAPTLIVASNVPDYQNAMADCALALQNIFLAAQSLCLGSCYINQLRWLRGDAPLREYLAGLGIPREHVICSAAAVGYAAVQPSPPERKKGTVLVVR